MDVIFSGCPCPGREDELTMRKDMLRGLINTLLDVYPSQIDSMAGSLGAQFRRADYPSTDEIVGRSTGRINGYRSRFPRVCRT